MPYSFDESPGQSRLPLVSKCQAKNGAQSSAAGSGGCACKRRLASPTPDETLPEPVVVETTALLVAAETATATMDETPATGAAACGCGHHAAESAASQQAEGTAASLCKCQKLLWIRRTHSACGLIFGLFLVEHLAATALGLRPELFEPYMRGVHAAVRQTPWLEILVFFPLAMLIPFGLFLLAKAGLRYHVKKCKRGGKLRFFLQRVSAVVILAFIAFHLLTLRNWGPWSAATEATRDAVSTPGHAATTALATAAGQIWAFLPAAASSVRFVVTAFYLLGTAAAVYHFANGLWTGGIAWGFTPSDGAQQRSIRACTVLGIMLLMLGTLGWFALVVAAGPA